ncbi:hypothetical protein [Gordonia sp. NPDC058843]|uniref:hypothetical protein n=1 Tax=Gordonia sp. NPDC058843 TaxID=3346648 RepID=UPI0036B93CF5
MARTASGPTEMTDVPHDAERHDDSRDDPEVVDEASGASADPDDTDSSTTEPDEVDTEAVSIDADDTAAPSRRARLSALIRRRGVAAVTVLCLVASVSFLGHEIWHRIELNNQDHLRTEYLAAAREGILALTTVSSKTADTDVQRLLSQSSGDFKTEFTSRSGSYAQIVKEAQVASTGSIIAIGVERMDDTSATLLVAAHAEVTNEGTEAPEDRDFRFRVVVTNGEPMTISKVDFVL